MEVRVISIAYTDILEDRVDAQNYQDGTTTVPCYSLCVNRGSIKSNLRNKGDRMKAPQLTEKHFKTYRHIIAKNLKTIGKTNAKGCRKNFTLKAPQLPDGYNAHLVILNHKSRWFYAPMVVRMTPAGNRLLVKCNPDIMWAGYIIYEGKIYPVSAATLNSGVIPTNSEIPLSEVES